MVHQPGVHVAGDGFVLAGKAVPAGHLGTRQAIAVTTPATLFASSAADVTLERVRQLVSQNLPEGLTLEYKETYTSNLVKSVAAMANSYGGIILVGVQDGSGADRLAGVSEEAILQITNACHDSFEPPWEPEIIPVPLDDGSGTLILVVRIDFKRAPRPVLMNGSAPIRLQGRNAIADRDRLAALFAGSTNISASSQQVLPQPTLPTRADGTPDADFVLRSGFWLPLGEAAGWRPLPERGVDQLADALNRSALGGMLHRWAERLHFSGLNLFDRRGLNRARRARLVWQAAPPVPAALCPIEAIAHLSLPEPRGAAAASASFTVDVVMRLGALFEGARERGWPVTSQWRVTAFDLHETIDGLLAGLVERQVVNVLAEIAGIDPVMVPQPSGAHFITGPAVADLLAPEGLAPITEAGASHGANLVGDPSLDLSDLEDRQGQVDNWVQQIALDAGLRGMESVLARRKLPDNPAEPGFERRT